MKKKRPSVGSLSMQNYPNKSAGTIYINPSPPVPSPPVNIELPLLSGTGAVESTVTCSSGVWTGYPTPTYTYIFYVDGIEEQNSSSNEFFVHESYDGLTITAEVTATNTEGSATEPSSNSIVVGTIPVNTVEPTLSPSGVQSTGTLITINERTWDGTPPLTFEYRWLRDGIIINGEEGNTYIIQAIDDGRVITAEVRATNAYGVSGWIVTSNQVDAVDAVAPVFTVAPQISGTAVVGQTLTCDGGTVTGTEPITKTYQWYRGATLISGATNSTYTLVSADAGNTSNIKCVVTATNSAGSASADSNTVAQILDADANTFFTAMGLTNSTIIAAENNFFISRKNVSVLSNAIASYHMVTDKSDNADRLSQFKFNAYSPIDADANKRLTYSGTLTANTTGLQGGANGFANTFINPSLSFTTNDFTLIYIIRTNSTANQIDLGAFVSTGGLQAITKFGDGNTYISPLGADASLGNIISNTIGIYFLKRSGNSVTLKRNNVTIYSNTIASSNKPNINTYILARNNNGTAQVFSQREYSFFEFINGALTAQQETDFYNALVTRETALGR